jgi:hypothetical protein
MVPVSTQTRPISITVTIKSIIVMLPNAMASAFTDADAVRTDRHFGLGQRDRIARNSGGACEGGERRQAERSQKYKSSDFHDNLL